MNNGAPDSLRRSWGLPRQIKTLPADGRYRGVRSWAHIGESA